MATGAFSAATIATDAAAGNNGALLTLVFSTPGGGGWTAPFTAASSPTLWPVVHVGGAAVNDTLNCMGNMPDGVMIATSFAVVGSDLVVILSLTGYAYSGESVTVDVPAGFVTDASGNTSGSTSGTSATNNSTKSAGSAKTRHKGNPVVAWAMRDAWPHDGTAFGDVPANRIRVAFDAFDRWAGVDYVEVTFSYAAVVASSAYVTSLGSNVYRITAPRRCDLFGYGVDPEYWYLDVDISSASDGDQGTVSITKVRTLDGVDHNPSVSHLLGGKVIPAYTLNVRKSKTLRYLDASASGAGTGLSWTDAYTDLSTCEAAMTTSIDEVRVAPGTYTEAGMTFDQSRTSRFLKWVYDGTGPHGAGTATFSFTGTTNMKAYQGFKGIAMAFGASAVLRLASTNHVAFDDVTWTFSDRGSTSNLPFGGSSHVSMVHVTQDGGYRGPSWGNISTDRGSNNLIHNSAIINSGTGASGQFWNFLIEFYTAYNNAGSAYTPGTHFDFLHPFNTISLSGAGYTNSTKTITKTSGFSSLVTMFDDEVCSVNVTAGTGVTTGEYRITACDANSITLASDINGAGGDIADASVAGSVHASCFENFIVRYCNVYDNGGNAGCNYNFALLETSGYNCAMYGNSCFSYQSTQQILQIQANPRNLQIVHNSFLCIDNDAQSDLRGVTLSGAVAANPYDNHGLLMVNNLVATYNGSVGGHFSSAVPNLYYRKRYYAGNIGWNQSPTNPIVDAYTNLSSGGLSTVALVDTSTVGAYVLSPGSLSPILAQASVGFMTYTQSGLPLSVDGTAKPSPGAWQPLPVLSATLDGDAVSDGDVIELGDQEGDIAAVFTVTGPTGAVVVLTGDPTLSGSTSTMPGAVTLTAGGTASQSYTISLGTSPSVFSLEHSLTSSPFNFTFEWSEPVSLVVKPVPGGGGGSSNRHFRDPRV